MIKDREKQKRYRTAKRMKCHGVKEVKEPSSGWWSETPIKEAVAIFIVTTAICMVWIVFKTEPEMLLEAIKAVAKSVAAGFSNENS